MSKLVKYENALKKALRRSLRLSQQELDEALSKGLIKLSDVYTGPKKATSEEDSTKGNTKLSYKDSEISIEDLGKTRQELLSPDYGEWTQGINNEVLEEAMIRSNKEPDEERDDETVNICVEEN